MAKPKMKANMPFINNTEAAITMNMIKKIKDVLNSLLRNDELMSLGSKYSITLVVCFEERTEGLEFSGRATPETKQINGDSKSGWQ